MRARDEAESRAYNLPGLTPWLTRAEPLTTELNTPALREPYAAATKNIQRADAIVQTIAAAFYGVHVATGEAPAQPSTEEFYQRGLGWWELSQQAPAEAFSLGIEGVLSAYLVQAHTAFETFAADVWEVAVNVHPRILAELRGTKGKRKNDSDGDPSREDAKSIRLDVLQREGYNLEGKMGTILRGKFGFDSLGGIRDAYRSAFSVDGEAILTPLEHESLNVIAALRQVIVHRSGIADREYERKTSGKANAPAAKVGEEIHLTGNLLSNLFLTRVSARHRDVPWRRRVALVALTPMPGEQDSKTGTGSSPSVHEDPTMKRYRSPSAKVSAPRRRTACRGCLRPDIRLWNLMALANTAAARARAADHRRRRLLQVGIGGDCAVRSRRRRTDVGHLGTGGDARSRLAPSPPLSPPSRPLKCAYPLPPYVARLKALK